MYHLVLTSHNNYLEMSPLLYYYNLEGDLALMFGKYLYYYYLEYKCSFF